eukprot:gene8566-14568_t
MATPKYLGHRIEILCFGILMWTSILMAVVQLIGAFEANNELQLDELLCRKCGHGITIADDLTSVPTRKALRQRNDTVSKQKDTLIQLFENPQGLKFELITTRKADVKTLGEKVAEYSWFPGFSWIVCVCPHCGFHLGWKFDSLDESEAGHMSFFGLIFSHLIGSSCK